MGIEWPSCVEYNGYLYCVGGATNGGLVSKVFYAQLSSSGVGPWTETTDYGAASGDAGTGGITGFQHACVADSGYVYCVGDAYGTSQVFYAQLSSFGVGPWKETTDFGATSGDTGAGGLKIASTACVDSSGYIYCVGGTLSFKPVSDVFYAQLTSSGVGAWTETTDYGASSGSSGSGGVPIYGTTCAEYAANILCIDGDTTGNTGTNGVYFAQDPGLLKWLASQTPFPEDAYWILCAMYYGPEYAFMFCYGGGDQGYSAPVQPTSTASSTSTSSSSTTTTSASTTSATSTAITSTTTSTTSPTEQTSVTTTVTPSTTSTTTTPVVPPPPGSFPLIPVAAILIVILGGVGFFLWRRGSTTEKPPPPPPTVTPPPTPVAPPPPGLYTHAPGCQIKSYWLLDMLDLNIFPSKSPSTFTTRPDEPVLLRAWGTDSHFLVHECNCPGVDGDKSREIIRMKAKTLIQWEIVQGQGGFVDFSGAKPTQTDACEEVLFQPPKLADDSTKTVTIQVTIKHDDPGKTPTDHSVTSRIILAISRRPVSEDDEKKFEYRYAYKIEPGPGVKSDPPPTLLGVCIPSHAWAQVDPIDASIYKFPRKVKPGEFVRVGAMGRDVDRITLTCTPSSKGPCTTPAEKQLVLGDPVEFAWFADKGSFPLDEAYRKEHGTAVTRAMDEGQIVVWHAPEEPGFARIKVQVTDSKRQYIDPPMDLFADVEIVGPEPPPPPLVTPPPAPVTRTKERKCDITSKKSPSDFACDVAITDAWTDPNGKGESLRNSITKSPGHSWDPELPGTAVAVSDGACVGGSVSAAANLRVIRQFADLGMPDYTTHLVASEEGSTGVEIEVHASPGSTGRICAGTLIALKAHSSVLDIPLLLYEGLKAIDETKEQIKEAKEPMEWYEKVEGWMEDGFNYAKEIGKKAGKLPLKAINKIRDFIVNAKVEVEAGGEMQVYGCTGLRIEAKTSKKLEIEKGTVKEPSPESEGQTPFVNDRVESAIGTCTAVDRLSLRISGKVDVSGEAFYGGAGDATVDSLWAVGWIASCCGKSEATGMDIAFGQSVPNFEFKTSFAITPEMRLKYPDTSEAAIRNTILTQMKDKLSEMKDQVSYFSPCDDPESAEEAIRKALSSWYIWIQNEIGLFVETPTEPPDWTTFLEDVLYEPYGKKEE